MRSLLKNRWRLGMAPTEDEQQGFRYFELNGSPWYPHKLPFTLLGKNHRLNEDLQACALMCTILCTLETNGHNLVCSAAVTKGTESGESDCDSWFWVEREANETGGWTPLESARAVARAAIGVWEPVEPLFDQEGRPIRPRATAPRSLELAPTVSASAPVMPETPPSPTAPYVEDGSGPPEYANDAPPAYDTVAHLRWQPRRPYCKS